MAKHALSGPKRRFVNFTFSVIGVSPRFRKNWPIEGSETPTNRRFRKRQPIEGSENGQPIEGSENDNQGKIFSPQCDEVLMLGH